MIVLDSSFLIGFYNERDAHHPTARALMDRLVAGVWGRGLLLEYVFLEIVTVLLVRRDLSVATRIGRVLLDAEELEFVPCSDLFAETTESFSNQSGTRFSFADAAIAGVARSRAGGRN
ncbi:MAG: PIN domain-containing protein [Acidobacteriota bacterium]|nr:PIN domain-containing protein [Acidobacteriota bacterium]